MEDTGFLLMSISKKLKQVMNRSLGEGDITISQWALLASMSRDDKPVTAAELATALDMDKPTVSGIVKRLVTKELIAESPRATDRRARDLVLTPQGRKTFQECAAVSGMTTSWFLQPLTMPEQEQLRGLLTKLDEGTNNE